MPQVNLGLVTSVHRQIPLYFKLFPGSVSDVTTLKNLIEEVKSFGITRSLFILDRGFYSESNIVEMASKGIDFIMHLPFGVKIGKGLISETNRDIENPPTPGGLAIGSIMSWGTRWAVSRSRHTFS